MKEQKKFNLSNIENFLERAGFQEYYKIYVPCSNTKKP